MGPLTGVTRVSVKDVDPIPLPGGSWSTMLITDVTVEVVWDPPWDQGRMSEDAKLAMNMY